MAVMAYCGPRGIPRSMFLSWPDDDQDAALAWAELDRVVCKRCGTEHADWDPKLGGDPEAFLPLRVTDQGCYLLDAAQANLADDAKEQPDLMFGARHVLVRREQHPDYEPADDVATDSDVDLIGGRR